jgi:hypothetical protein
MCPSGSAAVQRRKLETFLRQNRVLCCVLLSLGKELQEWFADKVDERDGVYSFSWNGTEEKAVLLEKEQDKFIRFRWSHMAKDEYFEFAIEKSEVTNQTVLVIKDFADKKEIKDQSQLWEYQVKDLFHRLGS